MQVYKFGGAAIATPQSARSLLPIIQNCNSPLVLVVSALGKTTNALEAIVADACGGHKDAAHQKAEALEKSHLEYAAQLLQDNFLTAAQEGLAEHFTELAWAIDDAEESRYNFWYDQMVSLGELFSTRIFAQLLLQNGLSGVWLDARGLLRTDDEWRDAHVDWDMTQANMQRQILPLLEKEHIVLTQGFIGANADNASTTLGREGSDYSAALVAAMLGAENLTIWKDVPGLKNADPREFADTVLIDKISYREVIEMAYYGAQVIHPKTIKPLQNNGIPLYVRCFSAPELPGTLITSEEKLPASVAYPPLITTKKDQVLIQATTRDFSFITEHNLANIYRVFASLNYRINLLQQTATSFVACVDYREDKLQLLISALEGEYILRRNEKAVLLTVRYPEDGLAQKLVAGKEILLQQKTRNSVQIVTRNEG